MVKKINLILTFSFLVLTLSGQVRNLVVEPNHSTIGFSISIAGFSVVTGKFTDYNITLDWVDSDPTQSAVSAEIKASSIQTGIPDRDTHLASADFFDTDKYPLITFRSDSISRVDFSNFIAFGTFQMHGTEKKIELPFQIVKIDGNTIGFRLRTKINRKEYGVGNGFQHTSMPDFLAENIDVKIDFWTKKRKQ